VGFLTALAHDLGWRFNSDLAAWGRRAIWVPGMFLFVRLLLLLIIINISNHGHGLTGFS